MESNPMKITCNKCGSFYNADIPDSASIGSIKCTCEGESGVDLAKEYASKGGNTLYHTRIAAFLKGYADGKAEALKAVKEWIGAQRGVNDIVFPWTNGVDESGEAVDYKCLMEFLEEQSK